MIIFPFFIQSFIYQNKKLPASHSFAFDQPFKVLNIVSTNRKDSLSAILFESAKKTSNGIIVYFHGNSDNLDRWGKEAQSLAKYGYDILVFDYPGYGKSTGKPSEISFIKSAETIMEWVEEKYALENIIIYGRSLGSAIATYICQGKEYKSVILETSFYDMPSLVDRRFFPLSAFVRWKKNIFPVYKYIQKIKIPILIIQGDKDRITPYKECIKLKQYLDMKDKFVTIEKGKHKNLNTFTLYQETLDSWMNFKK